MKYVSGRIVRGIYTWLGWSGEVAEPVGSSVPVWAHYFLLALPLPRSNPKRRQLEIRPWGITQKGTNYI